MPPGRKRGSGSFPEVSDPHVHGADRVRVPDRGVLVPASRGGLVRRVLRDGKESPEPRVGRGERSLAEGGKVEQLEGAEVQLEREGDHGLAELLLAVQVLDAVGLVDDVDEVARLDHSPEHPVEADDERVTIRQVEPAGEPQVEVGALPVVGVDAKERSDGQTVRSLLRLRDDLGLDQRRGGERLVPLVRELRVSRKAAQLGGEPPRELELQGGRLGHGKEKEGEQQKGRLRRHLVTSLS